MDPRAFKYFRWDTTLWDELELGVTYAEDCLTLRRSARKFSDFDGPTIVESGTCEVQPQPLNEMFRMRVRNLGWWPRVLEKNECTTGIRERLIILRFKRNPKELIPWQETYGIRVSKNAPWLRASRWVCLGHGSSFRKGLKRPPQAQPSARNYGHFAEVRGNGWTRNDKLPKGLILEAPPRGGHRRMQAHPAGRGLLKAARDRRDRRT